MTGPSGDPVDPPAFDPAIGAVVGGRYRIDELVGRGGMGSVYRATQVGLFRAVAIKFMREDYAASPTFRQRFEREARVMAALDHPNAVKVFDYGREGQRSYLVMEMLVGRSLASFLGQRRRLDVQTAASIGVAVASVLVAAHRIRLVHRDLKPENIFVLDGVVDQVAGIAERIRVVDFGLAFIEEAGDLGRLTRASGVIGTPTYVAPEQAAGRPVQASVDLYALGVVLFELVAGRPPFVGDAGELLAKHIYSPAPSIESVLGSHVDNRYEDLVALLLKKAPESRPKAEEVLDALQMIAGGPHVLDDVPRPTRALDASVTVDVAGRAAETRELPATRDAMNSNSGAQPGLVLVCTAALPEAVAIALATLGVRVVAHEGGSLRAAPDAVLAGTGDDDDVQRAFHVARSTSAREVPVLAMVDPLDLSRVVELIRLGLTDLVPLPIDAQDVARRVMRATRVAHAALPERSR